MNDDLDLDETTKTPDGRLSQLSVEAHRRTALTGRRSKIIKNLRFILPFIALVMTVIILTWNEGGQKVAPLKKEDVIPASQNIENELVKPVFNSVDDKNQPYSVSADKATQSRTSPDLLDLQNPTATLTQNNNTTLDAKALNGVYEQKTKKLNLSGDVELHYSEGYVLKTPELRVDMQARKAYSAKDVLVEGAAGTLEAKGLEGDEEQGIIVFTGPARIVLKSTNNMFESKGKTP